MTRNIIVPIIIVALSWACSNQTKKQNVDQWDVCEITINGPHTGNPYMDVALSAVFSNKGENIKVPGFYDGNGIYHVRFSPPGLGTWSYRTVSNVTELSDKKGKFRCIKPSGKNHGPVRVVNTYYLEYSDGTPFYSVGTTAYQWTSVKQSIQDKTIETLEVAPFNKIRMCVFPKWYRYGNDTEP